MMDGMNLDQMEDLLLAQVIQKVRNFPCFQSPLDISRLSKTFARRPLIFPLISSRLLLIAQFWAMGPTTKAEINHLTMETEYTVCPNRF